MDKIWKQIEEIHEIEEITDKLLKILIQAMNNLNMRLSSLEKAWNTYQEAYSIT